MPIKQILQFLIIQGIAFGVIIFILRRVFLTSTQGAVKRLDSAVEENRKKQAELNEKIKAADEELAKRKKEADEMTKKMIEEAEEKAKEEREKMIQKARTEGEEILSKAQRTKDQIRAQLEKELEMKSIDHAAEILKNVLSERSRERLEEQLLEDFLANLKEVDMSQVGSEIETADIITAKEISKDSCEKISNLIKEKLGRDIGINNKTDPAVVGGVMLRFGSLALDGSLQNQIKEFGMTLKEKVERE